MSAAVSEKSVQRFAEMKKVASLAQYQCIFGPYILLQAYECRIHIQQR